MTALVVLEAAAIVLLGLLVVGLLRSHAEILRQLHQLGAGREDVHGPTAVDLPRLQGTKTPAHDLAGQTPGGEAVAVGVLKAPQDALLAFLSSGCLTCAGFWSSLGGVHELGLPAGTRVIAVTKGPGEESESAIRELTPPGSSVVMSTQAWLDYQVPGSPYFVHVEGSSGRVVGEGSAGTWQQVLNLATRAASDRMAGSGRDAGQSDDADREARIDQELTAAGIRPGDPRLYPTAPPVSAEER